MFCRSCGKEIPDDSRFCDFCGADQTNSVPNTPKDTKKKNTGIVIACIVVGVLLIALIVCAIVFRDRLFSGSAPADESFVVESDDAVTAIAPPAPSAASAPAAQTAVPTPPAAAATPAPRPQQTPAAHRDHPAAPTVNENPVLDDFSDYETIKNEGTFAGAASITDFPDYAGEWKALLVYDPENASGGRARELATATIEGTETAATLRFDLYEIYYEGEAPVNEEGISFTFTGSYHDDMGGLYLTGSGSLFLPQAFSYNGTQYMYGGMTAPDGSPVDVLLVRP